MRMKEEQQKDEMQQKAGTKPGLCRQARAWCCDKNKQKNLRIIKIEKTILPKIQTQNKHKSKSQEKKTVHTIYYN